jgi:hypothetical protein
VSERAAIVNDTFHGKDVQLDGYSVILTIKHLKESDINISYRLELSYGASQTVQYYVLLESASKYLRYIMYTTNYKKRSEKKPQTNKQTNNTRN